ncbi:hypothetical protein E2P60_03175 [Candidatus Bathyarchaeota archaeon]|nr:hypothetical protein E2P60_03175 [Candidatus Bathyarchaeota archaeon]
MKRALLVALCILALCSLLFVNTETVKASPTSGYTRIDWPTQTIPNIDGAWSPSTEWEDTDWTTIGNEAAFGSTWDSADAGVYTRWLVEFFNDTTNDEGDYWQICLDNDDGGGTAPASTHYRIDIEGHQNLTMYQGTGTGWTGFTPLPEDITWKDTLSASPNGSTPHWILEFEILKNAGSGLLGIIWGVRVAMYDASDGTLLVWPPDAERDVPNDWGTNGYEPSTPWPEGFSIEIVVLLSSAALVAGFFFLRKKSRIDKHKLGQLGK